MTEKQYIRKVTEARRRGESDLGDSILRRSFFGCGFDQYSLISKDGNVIDVSHDPMDFEYLYQ